MPDKDRKLYLSIFISLTLSIVLTMLVLSLVLYVNFENIALAQVYSHNMNILSQTGRGVSSMTKTAMTLSNQIYNDLNVARLLYYSQPDITDIRTAADQLTNYRLTLPFIDSVYVYNGKDHTFYINAVANRNTTRETIQSTDKFDDRQALSVLKNYRQYKQYIPIPREFTINIEEGIKKYYYTFLFYDAFSGAELDSAVFVNISEEWIREFISDKTADEDSEMFIIDSKGVLVSNSRSFAMMTDLSGESYIRRIVGGTASKGYFVDNAGGRKVLITYTEPDSSGWRYISVTSWSVIFSKIEHMKMYTILIGVGILVLGLIVSFLVSRGLFVPIDNIITSLRSLEAEKRENAGILRQGILSDIITGREAYDAESVQAKFKKLGIKVDALGTFCMLLLKIDKYESFYRKYNAEDRRLFRFAIMNIATEIFSQTYKTEATDLGKDGIILLINLPGDDGSYAIPAPELVKQLQEAMLTYLKIPLSVTVSSSGNTAGSLNHLFNQVAEASLHRIFSGHSCIIFSESIMQLKQKEYNYPFHKEKLLIDALMAGKVEEAKQIYNEIVYQTCEYAIDAFNLTVSRLISSVGNAVNTIKKNNSISEDLEVSISILTLNNAEIIEDVNQQFYKLFEQVNRKLEERKNSKHEVLIAKIHDIIDAHYSDSALSIESIAASLNISPTYMCHLYKQYTLKTILDRVVDVRMEKARELLQSTQWSITDIAEKTGFTNSSYFYKAFKKANGATPNDFRKNMQAKPSGG